jgi:TPR repeat protein
MKRAKYIRCSKTLERNATMFTKLKMLTAALLVGLTATTAANAGEVKDTFDRYVTGVFTDKIPISTWEEMSEAGDIEATNVLGLIYDRGELGIWEPKTAHKYFVKTATQGNAFGQYYVSKNYTISYAVESDPVLASMWMAISAMNGYERAIAENVEMIAKHASNPSHQEKVDALVVKCVASAYTDCGA